MAPGTELATIYHQVWINASLATVYRAISVVEAIGTWWDEQTPVETSSGLVLEHDPGPEHGVVRLKVLDARDNARVEWECISSHPGTSPASAWTGTHLTFDLSERRPPSWMAPTNGRETMTVVDFRHSGWDAQSEYLGFCTFAWGAVLERLKQTCESASNAVP